MRMLKQLKWSYLVVDEGHRLKNKDSKLFVVLTKEYESRRKLILTGTPLQNNIGELWNLLNFLLPTVFDTDADFKTWFSKPFTVSQDQEEEEASQEEQMVLINRLHQARPLPTHLCRACMPRAHQQASCQQGRARQGFTTAWRLAGVAWGALSLEPCRLPAMPCRTHAAPIMPRPRALCRPAREM